MILTLTPNPAVDETIEMDEVLEPDSVQKTAGMQFDSGGNGINVSQFVGALGGETVATGITGGFTGYFIRENLADLDVEADFCDVSGVTTRINTTILTPGEESLQTSRVQDEPVERRQQYQLQQPGPEVTADVVDRLIETLQAHEPDILNIGGSLPKGMSVDAIDRLATAGEWRTALNIHGDVLTEVEHTYEYCRLNRSGLETATGRTVESIDDCKDAALELHEDGFERVLASMASDGAVLVTPEKALYASAPEVDVADTVGAGDALLAGALWGYEQGWDDRRSLKAGVATAGDVVSVTGSSVDAIDPDIDDIEVWELEHSL